MEKIIKLLFLFIIMVTGITTTNAQLAINPDVNKIAAHDKQLDKNGNLLGWYKPEIPGASYIHVAKLASEFIKDGTPIDPKSGLPLYYISCCFQGPHLRTQEEFDNGLTWEGWMHNPACVWAGLVQSLVLDYRVYSGDETYIDLVRGMLDFQLENGTTPSDWPWANVPYASSDPGETIYQGATRWEHDGMRGDGLHGIEPDKIGELGIAYLLFFEVTEETKYLDAAIHCANALVKYVKDEAAGLDPFTPVNTNRSPWPFRVNARTGVVIDHYCSNVIEPIRLFDELIRISDLIDIDTAITSYKNTREKAWNWLYSKNGPMKTGIWNAYFEDIPNDPDETNRVQITPMETALVCVSDQPGISSKNGPHLLVFRGYSFIQFRVMSNPRGKEPSPSFFISINSRNKRIMAVQFVVYEDSPASSPVPRLLFNFPTSPVVVWTLNGRGEWSLSPSLM